MDCTLRVAKTKAPISFAVTAKLICVFVFAYAKSRFSNDAAYEYGYPMTIKTFKGYLNSFNFTNDYI